MTNKKPRCGGQRGEQVAKLAQALRLTNQGRAWNSHGGLVAGVAVAVVVMAMAMAPTPAGQQPQAVAMAVGSAGSAFAIASRRSGHLAIDRTRNVPGAGDVFL